MAVKSDERKEWIRSRRERRKGARAARYRRQIFRYLLLVSLLTGGIYAFKHLPWTITNTDEDIIIKGNQVVSNEQVRHAIADYVRVPIYKIDPKLLERKIRDLDAVKYAFVRRYAFPAPKLVVEVLEEFPFATFSFGPQAPPEAVIAQSGRMISLADYPRIVAPGLKIYGQPGMKMTSQAVSQWASWSQFIAEQTKQPVDSIDMRQPQDVRVQAGDLCFKLGAPDATLTRRLGRLSSVMTAVAPLRSKLEYIDLALDNNVPLKLAKKSDAPHGITD